MRSQADAEDPAGDAWERVAEAVGEREGSAKDHGPGEAELLSGREERLAVPLTHLETAKLKSALLTAAVHMVKCGGERIGVTAAGIRNMSRADVLRDILGVHERSEDDSQMLAIAIEHGMH
jgi:hypothetical protein